MIGVTLLFDDATPVWREIPQVPSAGDLLSYDGRAYRVEAVAWFGSEHTWAAEVRCARIRSVAIPFPLKETAVEKLP